MRLTPLRTPWQTPLEIALRVDEATWQHRYTDYWGTPVRVFEAERPHRTLVVDASTVVEVDDTARPPATSGMSWPQLVDVAVADRYGEYLGPTPNTRPDEDLADMADQCAAGRSPHEAALAICTAIHDAMTYRRGSTGVHTVARDAWLARSGVCQDYAHLVVGALRHVGIPARYASGYLHPRQNPVVGEAVSGESHAWVEWWLGSWIGHDPTNDGPIGERHVVVGRGRDYNDVPPIRGIIAGAGRSELEVSVEITKLA